MHTDLFDQIADTLLSGHYNLLIGAGASLDSQNSSGARLPSGTEYLKFLSEKKGVPPKYSLQDVYSMVSDAERETLVTRIFERCVPGPTIMRLTTFIWGRMFTFNIDDAFEVACDKLDQKPQQRAIPIHFKDPYIEPRKREELHVIHLHGITRRPDDGYVFSKDEYIRLIKANSVWMTILTQFIRSEPFIIAGTSLDEIDVHYYLSFRDAHSNDAARAPSILIEPFPDAMTEHRCKIYGLTLFKGTILDFFDQFSQQYPSVPRLDSFVPLSATTRFAPPPSKVDLAHFLGDFEFVERTQINSTNVQSNFFFGGPASWEDFERHYDVERRCTNDLRSRLRKFLAGEAITNHFLLIDDAGGGKTTIAGRLLYDLASDGKIALRFKGFGSPDVDRTAKLLNSLGQRAVIHIDSAAEAATWLSSLMSKLPAGKIIFVLTERAYREEHVKVVLSEVPIEVVRVGGSRLSELKRLLSAYSDRGLMGSKEAAANPGSFSRKLISDPIALAVCRILNNFRSIDQIAGSLLAAADADSRWIYFTAAIAVFCHPAGVRLSILLKNFNRSKIVEMSNPRQPLPITIKNNEGMSYVTPANRLLSERIMHRARTDSVPELKEALFFLGENLAPFVSRQTIIQGTPEARASRRLFNYDEVVTQFVPRSAEEFYERMEPLWAWNSRYWEQKALLRLNMHNKSGRKNQMTNYLRDAVAHARHANTIETHPFPLTTLGNVLMAVLEVANEDQQGVFEEAFNCFNRAISMESGRSRVSIQPLLGIMKGAVKFQRLGGSVSEQQKETLERRMAEARSAFPTDRDILHWCEQVKAAL